MDRLIEILFSILLEGLPTVGASAGKVLDREAADETHHTSPLSVGSSVLDALWIVAIILEQPAYALVVPSGQSALGCSFCCSRCCPE
jgi:hypothetical protein